MKNQNHHLWRKQDGWKAEVKQAFMSQFETGSILKTSFHVHQNGENLRRYIRRFRNYITCESAEFLNQYLMGQKKQTNILISEKDKV